MTDPQVQLTRLTVQGFKSLANVEVELGTVNVFIGANGSGKSNLLESLGYLSAVASGIVDEQALLRRGVRPGPAGSFVTRLRELSPSLPTRIVSEFAAEGGTIERGAYAGRDSVYWPAWADEEKFRDDQGVMLGSSLQILEGLGRPNRLRESGPGYDDSILSQLSSAGDMLADYAIFAPNAPALRGNVADITQREPIGLAGGQLAVAVRSLLKPRASKFGSVDMDELLNLLDWVEKIAVVPPSGELVSPSVPTLSEIIRFSDRWMVKGRNELSAFEASEGSLYVLFALVLALHPKAPRLFAVENLDQNMHPRLARATMRLFCETMLKSSPARRALLTTHNPLVLDGLNIRNDRIRLFTVDRDRRGATDVRRVRVSEEMLSSIEGGLSLSNLWLMGRLGGVPDLF